MSAGRLAIAALVALAFVRRLHRLSPRREIAFALAGLALAVHFASWIASLEYTSVAISTLLVTTTPIWTELFDVVREGRPPSRAYVSALVLALGGVTLIVTQHAAAPAPIGGHVLLGDLLALAGSIAIGAYFLLVREAGAAFEQDATQARLGTPQIVARTYGWSALALLALATFAHEPPPPLADTVAWGGIVAMALVSQLIGHTALNAALGDFTPSVVALSTLLEPVVAAVLAAVLFGEMISAPAFAGGICVLVAIGITLGGAFPLQPKTRTRPVRR